MIIRNGLVFEEDKTFSRRDLYIENGRIVASADEVTDQTVVDAEGLYVLPGLIDIHSHGAVGCDFSDGDVEGLRSILRYQRAHGISEGKYISFGALEHLDMLAWVKKINEMNPDDKVIIHGLSMGGGIALDLADKDMKNVKGIIADAPSVSIQAFFGNIAKEVFKKESEKVAFFALERFQKEFGADAREFESVDMVSNSKYPILLSAGSNEHLEELFAKIKSVNPQTTEIIILPDCNHGNGMYKQTELYQNVIREFIDNVL